MGLGLGLGIQFKNSLGRALSEFLTWGQSIPARFWGTESPEYWGGIDAQAQVHYNRVIADGGVVPAGLGGVNSFFQVVKEVYGTSDINTAISAAYDAHYLGYKLGAGSGTTLGQAAQKLYAPKGIFGGIGTGSAFWEGVGVNGNFVSTPNAAANQITGDIDLIAFINMTTTSYRNILTKDDAASNRQFIFSINNTLQLGLNFGAGIVTYNSTINIPSGANVWIRATRNATNGEIRFFTSNDASTTNPQSVTWTQLGTTVSGSTGSTINGNSVLCVGAQSASGVNAVLGQIFRATIANSIGGTPVVNFNANQYTGANTWTSTTSEVWTVNSTGAGLADVVQTTAASQPLLLAHTGDNYWWGSGVSGNFASTPNAVANQITGNIDIKCNAQLINWTAPSAINVFASKDNGVNLRSWQFNLQTNGTLRFAYSIDGTTLGLVANTTVTTGFSNNQIAWVRVSLLSATGTVVFYTSTDGENWTTLETISTGGTTFATANTAVSVGARGDGTISVSGKIYRATIANSIGGTPVVDFNPASYNPSVSQTQWSSATGEVWSLNVGTATSGYKSALVDRSIVQGDGINDSMASGTLASRQYFTSYSAARIFNYLVSSEKPVYSAGSTSHILYSVISLNGFNGVNIISGNTSILLNAQTVDFNSTSSKIRINAGSDVLGNTGTQTSTDCKLMVYGGTTFGNVNLNTLIQSISLDSDARKTSIYNYLKQINNGAF